MRTLYFEDRFHKKLYFEDRFHKNVPYLYLSPRGTIFVDAGAYGIHNVVDVPLKFISTRIGLTHEEGEGSVIIFLNPFMYGNLSLRTMDENLILRS